MTPFVLVDSSVWMRHFKHGDARLATLLAQDQVAIHPFIIGEIACGTPPRRVQLLGDLRRLRSVQQCSLNELLAFIDRHQLQGLGCGLVDLFLLASTLMTPVTQLWTADRRLDALARHFGVASSPRRRSCLTHHPAARFSRSVPCSRPPF